MRLTRRIKIQLAIFTVIARGRRLGHGLRLHQAAGDAVRRRALHASPWSCREAGGLYPSGNVTYRGTEVGRSRTCDLTDTGVEAVLSLQLGRRRSRPT